MDIIPALKGFHDISQSLVIENIHTSCPTDIFIYIDCPLFNSTGRSNSLFTWCQRNDFLIRCGEVYFSIYKSGITCVRIIVCIDIKCSTEHRYFSKARPDNKRMFLVFPHIKISLSFQRYNSAFSDKTGRVDQFRTGIQMNGGSISKKDSILSSPRYNQFI